MGTKTYEFLRNFRGSIPGKFSGISQGKNSGEIPGNFSKLILLLNSPKNPQTWGPSSKNFSGISGEIFRRSSQEFLGVKFRRNS